jgi:hypothetical protein
MECRALHGETDSMRKFAVMLLALTLSACAGAYVAADGGAHTGAVRIGQDGSR